MKINIVFYSILLLAILAASCKKERYQTESQTQYDMELFDAVNAHRASIGLAPFVHNDVLWQVANDHCENMANGDVPFGHEGLTERSDRIQKQIGSGIVAENVATGEGTASEIVTSWLASIGHKIEIEGNYTLTGLSAIKTGNGVYYYTQIFYRPR